MGTVILPYSSSLIERVQIKQDIPTRLTGSRYSMLHYEHSRSLRNPRSINRFRESNKAWSLQSNIYYASVPDNNYRHDQAKYQAAPIPAALMITVSTLRRPIFEFRQSNKNRQQLHQQVP